MRPELVPIKKAIAFTAAQVVSPAEARALIEAAAARAVRNLSTLGKPKAPNRADLEISFKDIRHADMLSWLPGVKRAGSRTIRFFAGDIETAVRFLSFISAYNANLP